MSLASTAGTVVGTATAYAVHYIRKSPGPITVVTVVYANRKEIKKKIQEFAMDHAIDKEIPNAIQNNLLDCLDYID